MKAAVALLFLAVGALLIAQSSSVRSTSLSPTLLRPSANLVGTPMPVLTAAASSTATPRPNLIATPVITPPTPVTIFQGISSDEIRTWAVAITALFGALAFAWNCLDAWRDRRQLVVEATYRRVYAPFYDRDLFPEEYPRWEPEGCIKVTSYGIEPLTVEECGVDFDQDLGEDKTTLEKNPRLTRFYWQEKREDNTLPKELRRYQSCQITTDNGLSMFPRPAKYSGLDFDLGALGKVVYAWVKDSTGGVWRSKRQPFAPDVGIAWYTPDKWERLNEISEDKTDLKSSYEEWLHDAKDDLRRLWLSGKRPAQIGVQVTELEEWCRAHGYRVDSVARAKFVAEKFRKQQSQKWWSRRWGSYR